MDGNKISTCETTCHNEEETFFFHYVKFDKWKSLIEVKLVGSRRKALEALKVRNLM